LIDIVVVGIITDPICNANARHHRAGGILDLGRRLGIILDDTAAAAAASVLDDQCSAQRRDVYDDAPPLPGGLGQCTG
jgi:hypothetical protein